MENRIVKALEAPASPPPPKKEKKPKGGNGAPAQDGAVAPKPASAAAPRECMANIHPGDAVRFPPEVLACVREIETVLEMPLWLIVQGEHDHRNPYNDLDYEVFDDLFELRDTLPKDKPVALLLHTGGGDAGAAYRIARLLKVRGGFTAIVPRYAKSAGTLLALGANRIVLAQDAELGPLDAQVFDYDREERSSALDEVHALDRLLSFALQAVDIGVLLVKQRSGKKIRFILPEVQHLVTDMTRPLFEKIDTVHYTQMSRILKVAEEYAQRLLQPLYSEDKAKEIAGALVNQYPEHDFMIDHHEAARIGLRTEILDEAIRPCVDKLMSALEGRTAIGQLEEVAP